MKNGGFGLSVYRLKSYY